MRATRRDTQFNCICYLRKLFDSSAIANVNNLNDMAAQANVRIPPSWGPELEKQYAFRHYESDLLLWASATVVVNFLRGTLGF